MVLSCGSPSRRRSLGDSARPKRPFAGDHHPLGHVAEHRVGRRAERAPGARAVGALALLPDDLAPGEQVQVVLQDRHDVGRQTPVRLAPQVRHVDRDAAPGLEDPLAVGEDVAQQLEVLDVGPGHAFAVELLLVLLAGEVGRRGDDERHRVVGHGLHVAGITAHARHARRVRRDVFVGAELGRLEAGVERVGDVRLAAPDTEVRSRGRSATAWRHGGSADRTLPAGPGPERDRARDAGSTCGRGGVAEASRAWRARYAAAVTRGTGAGPPTSRRRRRTWDVPPGRRASGPGRCTAGCASRRGRRRARRPAPSPPPAGRARGRVPRAAGATKRSSR